VSEDSLLERVTTAADERHLSQNTLTAYRRTWLKLIAWAAAEGLALETLPVERVGEFYEEATRGRSASHHLQVKAALALLYHVLGSTNPFAECPAPKFAPEKTELRYHISSQLGELLRELREERRAITDDRDSHARPAVLRLIRTVLEEVGQIPVSICGELAADLHTIPILLKFGIRSLSVAPPLVPGVKEAIRQTSLQTA